MSLRRLLPILFLMGPLACATGPGLHASTTPVDTVRRAPGELRVMTFNIQSGVRGLERVAHVIRAAVPDVVALQEVDVGSTRARGLDQTEELSRLTGLKYRAHFRTTDLFGGAYGIAVLSRFPLEALAQYPLPVPRGAEPRTLAHAVVDVDGREVSVYLTHLIRRPFNGGTRVRQSAYVAGLLARDSRPKVLMGDLNDGPDSRSTRLLRRGLQDVVADTGTLGGTYPLPLFLPTLRIDYVLACDAFTPVSSRVLRVDASDHYPVVADLRLNPEAAPVVAERSAAAGTAP
ncbi:endonuclease/exonuclease/phosphatase family protein [Corallococcus macrosporus]|uniref:Endonuclease/exonuclease/phosphatase family protein n=1 Tax=Myxococcus fulvus (strain ATCC BAA-855 / HW-1) TaxID=483219 RepID=F8CA92_MYXFH|nr:endonuclease/exonuclease/phosphatase family protein [Corallococcus macrosporus]AEI64549.1 endonuclease/exonuclease/phosphatase family protein [Corallococcus macrosporus]